MGDGWGQPVLIVKCVSVSFVPGTREVPADLSPVVWRVRDMAKNEELEGLPIIEAAESEQFSVAVSLDDLQAGDPKNPERHPVALALRRAHGIDDARVTKSETLIRRGEKWFRYDPPDKRLFKELQKMLTVRGATKS